MSEDELYIKNVIIPLEKMVNDQRIKVKKSIIFKKREQALLNTLEKELLSKYRYIENTINNKINVK